jgi:hypothetical protein
MDLPTRSGTPSRNQQIAIDAKKRPCADCGGEFPYYVMHLDHRPGVEKFFSIGSAYGSSWTGRDRYRRKQITEEILRAEIAKCDVVCANCHHIRTWQRSVSRKARS